MKWLELLIGCFSIIAVIFGGYLGHRLWQQKELRNIDIFLLILWFVIIMSIPCLAFVRFYANKIGQ